MIDGFFILIGIGISAGEAGGVLGMRTKCWEVGGDDCWGMGPGVGK
jgi:hypothetical protein